MIEQLLNEYDELYRELLDTFKGFNSPLGLIKLRHKIRKKLANVRQQIIDCNSRIN